MREIDTAVVHCAYTPPSMNIGAEEIRRWHVEDNGWSDIGYHYVIPRDGRLQLGRSFNRAGAHVRGHNASSVGICLIGGMREDGSGPEFNYTLLQMRQLLILLKNLQIEFDVRSIVGHCDLDPNKSCPNFNVKEWFHES